MTKKSMNKSNFVNDADILIQDYKTLKVRIMKFIIDYKDELGDNTEKLSELMQIASKLK